MSISREYNEVCMHKPKCLCTNTKVCAEGKVSTVCPLFWPSGTSGDGTAPAGPLLLLVPLQREQEEACWGFVCWFYCEAELGLGGGRALCGVLVEGMDPAN